MIFLSEESFVLYSKLITLCEKSTQKILDLAKEGKVDLCDRESRNRDCIIKKIKSDYPKIISLLRSIIANNKCSQQEAQGRLGQIQGRFKKIHKQDAQILLFLEREKESVKKEINFIAGTKKNIRQYTNNRLLK